MWAFLVCVYFFFKFNFYTWRKMHGQTLSQSIRSVGQDCTSLHGRLLPVARTSFRFRCPCFGWNGSSLRQRRYLPKCLTRELPNSANLEYYNRAEIFFMVILFIDWVRISVDTHSPNVSWIPFRVAKSRNCCSWASFLFSNYWLSKLQLYLWTPICYRRTNFIILGGELIL